MLIKIFIQEAAGYNGVDVINLEELVPPPRPMDREITLAREQFSLWSAQLLRPTLSLIFSWVSMEIIYYGKILFTNFNLFSFVYSGINFSIEQLNLFPDDNYLLAIAVVALVEIPAYLGIGIENRLMNLNVQSIFFK